MLMVIKLVLGLSMMVLAGGVQAQTMPCAQRERVLSLIIDDSDQVRMASAHAARGAMVELYAAPSGRWTLLLHLPNGRSCLMANGSGFSATEGLPPPRGEAA